MHRLRFPALVLMSAAVASAVALAVVGPAVGDRARDRGHGPPSWWSPPRDVRAMLGRIDSRSLERYDRALVGFGTRHTLSSQDDPNRGIGAARDWIRDQFAQIATTSDGRMTVELQSYIQPPASRIPVPTRITNVVATLRGTDPASADRVYVVSAHYDSRVTDVLNATSDSPGANDDGSGTSAVIELARVFAAAPDRGDDRLRRLRRRGAGALRLHHFAAARQAEQLEHPGRPEHGHHRQLGRRQRRARSAHDPRLLGGRADQRDAGSRRRAASRSAARTTGSRASSPATSRRPARTAPPACASSSYGAATASCAAATRSRSSQRGWPAVRFTEPNENYDHQHQDVRVENGRQFGDLLQFVDFDYLERATRVVGSSLAALARSPRAPVNARVITADLTYDTELRWNANPEPDVVGYEVVWRDSIDAAVDALAAGRQRDRLHDRRAQQGRLPGRRQGDRPRRQPQPRRLPDPCTAIGDRR